MFGLSNRQEYMKRNPSSGKNGLCWELTKGKFPFREKIVYLFLRFLSESKILLDFFSIKPLYKMCEIDSMWFASLIVSYAER